MERRRRAEQVLVSVVATSYLLGVSTRRVEKLVGQLGIAGLSKSQVSEMAKSLDEQVEASRSRPLDDGPYAFVWLDALTQKVREHGRTQVVHALIAVGVTADGQREVLGLEVVSGEDGAGWLGFLRSLVTRGLSGVALVISDSHQGLVSAVEATLPRSPCPEPAGSGVARIGAVKKQAVAFQSWIRCSGMGFSEDVLTQLAQRFEAVLPHLNERQRRLVLGREARLLGHGGVRAVAAVAGVSETTVRAGVFELEVGEPPVPGGRVRRAGGGRRPAEESNPALLPALLALVESDERACHGSRVSDG